MRRYLIAALSCLACLAVAPAAAQATPPNTGDFMTPFTTSLISPSTSPPNRSVGKLYLRFPTGVTESCSASVVDANNQSTLITAGHCVYSSSRGGLATSATFVPGFHDGIAPFGEWSSLRIVPSGPWVLSGHSHFDFAFIVLRHDARGRYVEDVVGGLPIAFNQPRNQAYHLLGYPGVPNPPYNGQLMWACDSTYGGDFYDPDPDEQYGPPIMYTGCNFDHGASGGPWLNPQGTVSSVISTTFSTHPNIVGGPYLGDDAAALFASVTGTAPPRKCKRKKGHKSAVASKKKCKKHRRHR
jgi:V8-like Glu-specific endopeptidase